MRLFTVSTLISKAVDRQTDLDLARKKQSALERHSSLSYPIRWSTQAKFA